MGDIFKFFPKQYQYIKRQQPCNQKKYQLLGCYMAAQLLTEAEIKQQSSVLNGWTVEGSKFQCTRKFKDFIEAIEFVNKLVEPAESAGHHPDIEISYNQVKITLTTHDAGGLTQNDFDLAGVISQIGAHL